MKNKLNLDLIINEIQKEVGQKELRQKEEPLHIKHNNSSEKNKLQSFLYDIFVVIHNIIKKNKILSKLSIPLKIIIKKIFKVKH